MCASASASASDRSPPPGIARIAANAAGKFGSGITITQAGASPSELETQVTKKVEDAVAGIVGIKHRDPRALRRGDPVLEAAFTAAAFANPGQVAVRIAYDEAQAHRLIGGD